jgi:transcriptional regulator with XRE-family HTH domain
MESARTLGHKIRKMRELRNLTQEHVASKLGISQSNYARMESNDVSIPDKRLAELSEILQTTPEAIRNFDETIVFNITQGDYGSAGQNVTVNNYQISPELQKLYEDKIRLLEEKIIFLEDRVQYLTTGSKKGN